MKTISLSEAKATLSEQLRHVREGEEVVITHRGKAIARIVPMREGSDDGAIDELVAAGLVQRGSGGIPPGFWALERPADPGSSVRGAVDSERESGW